MNLETIREFLGWCTAINVGLLVFSSLVVIAFRREIGRIHGRMFEIGEAEVQLAYFRFLANYKIAIIVLNIVPYLALRIMA